MKKQLTSIAPLRAGIVMGVLSGLLGLLFVPIFLLVALFGSKASTPVTFGGVFFAILFPAFYAIAGFVGGTIAAAIYNLVAKWTGGLEFDLRDLPNTA